MFAWNLDSHFGASRTLHQTLHLPTDAFELGQPNLNVLAALNEIWVIRVTWEG